MTDCTQEPCTLNASINLKHKGLSCFGLWNFGLTARSVARFVGVDAFETTGLGEDEGLQDGLSLLVIGNSFLVVSTDR